jgi:hypothetical protein
MGAVEWGDVEQSQRTPNEEEVAMESGARAFPISPTLVC